MEMNPGVLSWEESQPEPETRSFTTTTDERPVSTTWYQGPHRISGLTPVDNLDVTTNVEYIAAHCIKPAPVVTAEVCEHQNGVESLDSVEEQPEELPKGELPREELPKQELPREELPKEELPKEELPNEELPKEELSKEGLTKSNSVPSTPGNQTPLSQIKKAFSFGRKSRLPGFINRRTRSAGTADETGVTGSPQRDTPQSVEEPPMDTRVQELEMNGGDRSSSERSASEEPQSGDAVEDIDDALTSFERQAIFGRSVSGVTVSEDSVSLDDKPQAAPRADDVTSKLSDTYDYVSKIFFIFYGMLSSALSNAYRRTRALYRRLRGLPEEEEPEEAKDTSAEDELAEKNFTRMFHIASELLTTEEAYVERLGLLCTAKEKATKILNPDLARDMFKDIHVMYQFHKDNFLPQLRERMDQWSEQKHIGDIMKKLAPFLKLYTEYVKDYSKAAGLVEKYEKQSTAFAAALKEIKESQGPRHGKLTIQAHMMEPIQRVPRYELLLRDYLKRVPNNSEDKEDATQALQCVSEAAKHFENMMKRDTRICQLMGIQARLDGNVNIVEQSSRELVKEARIQRILYEKGHGRLSAKYAFLFNDMLLICNKQKLIVGKYKVRVVLNLCELENVFESKNLDYPFTFYLKCCDEDLELCGYTQEETREWVEILTQSICKLRNMETSLMGLSDLISMSQDEASIVRKDYLLVSDDEGKSWRKRWFALHNSGVLFAYQKHQDSQFCGSLNTRMFIRSTTEGVGKKGHVVSLQWEVRDQVKYYFYDDATEELDKWLEEMNKIDESKKKV